MEIISILEKSRAPSRIAFCERLGRETLASSRLLGSDDDDLLRSAHHLRRFRDRILELVGALRDRLHREHLAVLGDLLGEPVRDDLLHFRLPALGLQRLAEFGNRGVHFGRDELGKLRDQIGLALVARPRKRVGEQVVAGHEVQDVVHPVDVSRGDEAARGDAQHITEVKLFRLHGLFSSQGSDYRDSLATRVWTYNSITDSNVAYYASSVKSNRGNRKSPYFRAFSRFLYWIKKFSSLKIKTWFEPMFLTSSFAANSRIYFSGTSVEAVPLVVKKAGIINPNNAPPKAAKIPLNNVKIIYPKFLYNFFCINNKIAIAKLYTMLNIAPTSRLLSKPSLNAVAPDCMLDSAPPIPPKIKPTSKYAK